MHSKQFIEGPFYLVPPKNYLSTQTTDSTKRTRYQTFISLVYYSKEDGTGKGHTTQIHI